jgi:two-component system, chemotaxis family, sensor kinase CheA
MNELDDLTKEFLVESNENLDQMDRDLVALETDPTSHEILSRIFRAIHTIKGTTGFLGFSKLESVAHAGENLLSKLRDAVLRLNPEITSALLATVDAVREMLASIEASGQDGDRNYSALIERLTALQAASPAATAPPQPAAEAVPPAEKAVAEAQPAPEAAAPPPKPEPEPVPEAKPIGEILIAGGRATAEQVAGAIEQQMDGDPRHVGEILVEQGVVKPAEVVEALQTQKEVRASALSSSNIRVDVAQLDRLMNLVGELVLARNQILQFSAAQQDAAFLGTTQRLNLITTELQEGVMKTRMQPIDNIWNKFPRVVRDLATSCGKRIRVEMEGKETELDKTLIEAIKDPLTHIVRNSADHGIERPEQREAQGKPAEGRLFLRAYHEGGQVNIEISDDGAGIAVDRVKRKAVDRGLITPEQAARMGEREALNLIFLPGLSTAEKITNVSGRGVGMDVVKTNLEKIGGTIDIQSQLGKGTTLKIKIPLTLAIIPALIITSAGERYAIPQISLLELVRLEGDEARKGIESIHGAPVYRLRGNLLPLAYLNHELGLESAAPGDQDVINIVVLHADDRQFGLVVDAVNDTEEIVVKPLGKQLKGIATFAGATIMGDGRVALILDVLGLAHRAKVISEVRERALVEDNAARERAASENRQTLLLLRSQGDGRIAVPLNLVTRLEEFPRSALEKTGNQTVVQYRDSILPLVRVSDLLQERRRKTRGPQEAPADAPVQVVVYSDQERSIGLVVERILDIVDEDISKQQAASRDGILGTVVIQGRVTELLDLEGLIRTHAAIRSTKDSLQKVSR